MPVNPQGESAPFNMAIATLMRLDAVLTDMKKISMAIALSDSDGDKASSLAIKISLARQFYIFASPLIPDGKKEKIKVSVNRINMPKGYKTNNDPINPQKYLTEYYSPNVDEMIDIFIIEVSEVLQKEGYFMPSQKDVRFAMRRE